MAIANQEMIRDNNRRQVLEYLVNHPPGCAFSAASSDKSDYFQYRSGAD